MPREIKRDRAARVHVGRLRFAQGYVDEGHVMSTGQRAKGRRAFDMGDGTPQGRRLAASDRDARAGRRARRNGEPMEKARRKRFGR